MLEVPPESHNFLIVGIHNSVDTYAIFRFEPVHTSSPLILFRMLKECIIKNFTDPQRTSYAIQYRSGEIKPTFGIRKLVLKYINLLLQEAEGRTVRNGLRLDFSKEVCGGRLSGLFTEKGTMGLLEPSDYNAIDQVFPFFGEIIDTHLLCKFYLCPFD